MRQFTDVTGLQITLETVSARNAYAGMLEGTPWMARKFRLMRGQTAMKAGGNYVYGLGLLEQEIASLPRDTDVWAPAEEWTARFVGCSDWSRKVELTLLVTWFQHECDPFEQLKSIIATIDFKHRAKERAIDVD